MGNHIPIYKAEIKDGVADKVRTTASIAYASSIQLVEPSENMRALATASDIYKHACASNEGQIDLYYMKSILATTGWNLNDDVFDKAETWVARYTPEDKPFNLEHDPRRVRGHITGNYVIDDNNNIIVDNTAIDDLPAKYHVVTTSVLYKFLKCPDPKLEEEMKTIVAEVEKGEWFVSMEALLSNFDYAVVASDGKASILPRSEETAFLTKHLRAYGGNGKYENYKVGRVLKNIIFSGKGLVRKPANPESIIFAKVTDFKPVIKEIHQLQTEAGYKSMNDNGTQKESKVMATDNELLEKQIKSLQDTVVASQKKNEELEQRLKDNSEKQVQAKLAEYEAQLKARDEKVTALAAQVATEQKARTDAEENLKKAVEKATALETEVAKAKVEQVRAARINQWVEHTGVENAVATKSVEKLMKLDDAEFKDFLETQPAKAAKKEEEKKVESTTAANKEAVDKAVPEKSTPLPSGGVDSNVEQTRAGLSNFLADSFLTKGRKKAVKSE